MCGRFTLHHTVDEIAERFAAETAPGLLPPSYNIAPSEPITVVVQEGARHLDNYRWGLIPSWAKDPEIGNRLINARADTLAEKPAFRAALTRRRCLIPSDGFYEWKPEGKARQPVYLRRADGGLFAFAGLWEEWHAPDGSPLRSCTIVTTDPNPLVAPIHNRMPAMLRPEDEAAWLDLSHNASDVLPLLTPYPADAMEAYPVSRQVNMPTFDDPACIQPLET